MISDGDAKISNTMIYDIENPSTGSGSDLRAILANSTAGTVDINNVTIYDVNQTGIARFSYGIERQVGTVTVQNSFIGKIASTGTAAALTGSITQAANVTYDTSATGTDGDSKTDYETYFYESSGTSTDLHWRRPTSDWWSGLTEADLDEDTTLPVAFDIDGDNRDSSAPDVGADENVNEVANAPQTPHCEGQTTPATGITDPSPEFSAICDDDDLDGCDYYEIEVNTASDFTGTVMWDSTKTSLGSTLTENTRSNDISYDRLHA